ncbi:MAG TPA: FliA/WhiG family RNA polymerase sigma factor [Ktedonobacteraceae bacterium]|nr:FliA/WhiG family RNA polymerase sigma factor [Ktedonobacteraceae bacterium]
MGVSAALSDLWMQFVATRDPALRDELITEYAPLVRFVVGRLGIPPSCLLDTEDLLSCGTIGLINAVDRYDPTRGSRFESFATARIRGAVIDHLRSLNWLPRTAMARARQIEYAIANLEQRLGRPPREDEITAEAHVSPSRYRQMLQEAGTIVLSLDAPLGPLAQDEGITSLADLLEDESSPGPDAQVEAQELLVLLRVAIDQLPERERLLLALYYHEELTMKEISKIMNVSESRVCQLHIQAILRLRTALHIQQGTRHARRPRRQHVATEPVHHQ